MSKNKRYIYTFIFTLIIFGFLWMYNLKSQSIKDLESELEKKEQEFKALQEEYAACKGEIFHKSKLLEMEKSKNNMLESQNDSL